MSDREHWLNGWPKIGNYSVLVGSGVHCAGCGKCFGITTIAIDEDYSPPDKLPDWPFDEETCPVHDERQESVEDDIPRIGLSRMKLINARGKLPP